MGEIHAGLGLFLSLLSSLLCPLFISAGINSCFYLCTTTSHLQLMSHFFFFSFFPVPVPRMYLQIETGLLCVFFCRCFPFFVCLFVFQGRLGKGWVKGLEKKRWREKGGSGGGFVFYFYSRIGWKYALCVFLILCFVCRWYFEEGIVAGGGGKRVGGRGEIAFLRREMI